MSDKAKTKKTKIFLIAICVAAAAFFFILRGEEAEEPAPKGSARPVKMMTLRRDDGVNTRVFPGEVRPARHVDLSFRVSGTLKDILVVKSQQVKEGELIAILDKRDFESSLNKIKSDLAGQEAHLSAMRAGARKEDISVLTAQVGSARATYDEAKVTMDRYDSLISGGAVSRAEYDRVRTQHDVALQNLRVAEQNLAKGRAGSRPEEIQMQEALINGLRSQVKAAGDALRDTELRAPFGGNIAEKYVENFQAVQRDQPIVSLQSLMGLEVAASIPATMLLGFNPDLGGLIPEEEAAKFGIRARFPSMPGREFNLRFKEISTRANVQTQTYDVTLIMDRPEDLIILPGMGVDVVISTGSTGAGGIGFPLPASVVEADSGNRQSVWKVAEENGRLTVHRTPVEIIGYSGDDVIASGDLDDGDVIVTAGINLLHEGEEVLRYAPPTERGDG